MEIFSSTFSATETFVQVAENAEKKIWIQLYDNKYFYENFNSNFSLQNKQLQHIFPIKNFSFILSDLKKYYLLSFLKTQRKKFPYSYIIINTSMRILIQTFLFKTSNFNISLPFSKSFLESNFSNYV